MEAMTMATANFIFLNDPGSQQQRLVRHDHISAVTINKSDQSIALLMLGGQEIHLTREESKQFFLHIKSHGSVPETP
jgi:hypothetical protein